MAGEREERRELAEAAQVRLTTSLDQLLGTRLVVTPGEKPDYFDDGVSVDAFSLTERCPRRLANPAQDFVDTVFTSRRRVGLLALRHLAEQPDERSGGRSVGPAMSIAAAVESVIEEQLDWPNNLRTWVRDMDRAGRAAVAAGAITWCHGVVRLVGRDQRIVWSDPSRSPTWNVPDRLVQLRASVDAIMGGVVSGERLLVVNEAVPGPADRLRAGFLALVRALGTKHAPVRITMAAPSTGSKTQVPIDAALLDLAVDRVLEVVQHKASPATAPALPGAGCRHCHLLEECAEGQAHVRLVRTGTTAGSTSGSGSAAPEPLDRVRSGSPTEEQP